MKYIVYLLPGPGPFRYSLKKISPLALVSSHIAPHLLGVLLQLKIYEQQMLRYRNHVAKPPKAKVVFAKLQYPHDMIGKGG